MGDIFTTVKGDPSVFLRRQVNDFDPVRGWKLDYDMESASQLAAQYLQGDLIAAGCSSSLTFENDKAILRVSDSTLQYVIDSWEIVGNNEVRDLFSHPAFVSFILGVNNSLQYLGDVCAALREALSNNASVTSTFVSGGTPNLAPFLGTIVSDFYLQYYLGDTGYRAAQYVVRHKTNVSNRWEVNIADDGVNQLYTPAQALAEMSSSGLWIYPLPGRLQFKLGAIPTPDYQAGYSWSYLKSASTETNAADNRVDITTEYSLDQWFVEQYGFYGDPPF